MNLNSQEPYPISHFLTPQKAYDPTVLAYLAGYFDGEGCVSYIIGKWRSSSFNYQLRISMGTSDMRSVMLFADTFGGTAFELGRYHMNKNQIAGIRMFRWALHGPKVVEPLRAMLPFLRSKDVEAIAVLESGINFYPLGSRGLPAIEIANRNDLAKRMAELKGIGRQRLYEATLLPMTRNSQRKDGGRNE